mmetsp:Transcript_8419/g.10645  ORF Transcript_8419/g.10645 Transcript_8419/m.10645 type:complete len:206 (-) Transcript_8419:282-899(-)
MTPTELLEESLRLSLRESCAKLKRKGIKLLAVDFDLTICAVHTGGVGRIPKDSLRPVMVALLEEAEAANLTTCVATFHSNADAVQHIISQYVKLHEPIVVRGAYTEQLEGSPIGGKSRQIYSAWKHLFGHDDVVKWDRVLLIDDDEKNVKSIRNLGTLGIHFQAMGSTEDFVNAFQSIATTQKTKSNGKLRTWKEVFSPLCCFMY